MRTSLARFSRCVIALLSILSTLSSTAAARDDFGLPSAALRVTSVTGAGAGTALKITSVRLNPDGALDLQFGSVSNTVYKLEVSQDLRNWTMLQTMTAQMTTATFRDSEAGNFTRRFYRVAGAGTATNAATVATLPIPGQLYLEGTKIGGSLLGVEFAIPSKWKGGLKANTPVLIFASETEFRGRV